MRFFIFIISLFQILFAQNIVSAESKNFAELEQRLLDLKIYEDDTWLNLLHYDSNSSTINKNSKFFLHKDGYKNPKSEYIATIESIFRTLEDGEDSAICKYPARIHFIANQIKDVLFDNLTDNSRCENMQDFLSIVPVDSIYINFAGESDMFPGSSMGHPFISLEGEMREDFQKEINKNILRFKKGDLQQYAISYYALLSDTFNPIEYVRAIIGNIGGGYGLSPYDNVENDYLNNEKRSIYKYKISTNKIEIDRFRFHLWELKDIEIYYAFITHNCTTGLEGILGVLNSSMKIDKYKPYQTPTEYLTALSKIDKITLSEVLYPKEREKFIKKYGFNSVLKTRKSAKVSLSYEGSSSNNQLGLYFSPIYSDIKNVDNAYSEFLESRMTSIEARIDLKNSSIFLHRVELLHLNSTLDFYRTNSLSKLISIRAEPNLYNHKKGSTFNSQLNRQMRLMPTVDIGVGFGSYISNIALYVMPNIGYRYEIIHNPYVAIKSGFILKAPKIRIMGDYSIYYDLAENNRGYDSKLYAFLGINIVEEIDFFIDGALYNNIFKVRNIEYQKKHNMVIKSGISLNF